MSRCARITAVLTAMPTLGFVPGTPCTAGAPRATRWSERWRGPPSESTSRSAKLAVSPAASVSVVGGFQCFTSRSRNVSLEYLCLACLACQCVL